MKAGLVNIDLNWQTVAALSIAAAGLYFLLKHEAGDAAEAIGDAVDPTDRDNIIYRGVNAVVDILDDGQDNDSNTVGTAIYDWWN